MRKILDISGMLLVLQGVGGIVHHFFGWFRAWGALTPHVIPDGYRSAAGFALVLLGFGVWVLGETLFPTAKEKQKKAASKSADRDAGRKGK